MRKKLKELSSGKFSIELWDEGHGNRAYLMVHPTLTDGRMYWDCISIQAMHSIIDKAIDDLQNLKKKSERIFDNMY